jgi:hypothetical protein
MPAWAQGKELQRTRPLRTSKLASQTPLIGFDAPILSFLASRHKKNADDGIVAPRNDRRTGGNFVKIVTQATRNPA